MHAAYAYDVRLSAEMPAPPDPHAASIGVIAHGTLLGDLKELAAGKKVLLNVSQEALEGDYVYALPKKTVIVSLDKSIAATAAGLAACHKLRGDGYQFALDGFGADGAAAAFANCAAFAKIDFTSAGDATDALCLFVKVAAKNPALQLIGAGLETRELYAAAFKAGCTFFQGNYFAQPEEVAGRDIQSFKLPFLQLLKEVHQENVNFVRVEQVIKQDVALTYKLLRYVNSAAAARREDVKSIQTALNLLGENELKRWVTLVGVSGLAQGKPKELLARALLRARFCESLASYADLTTDADDLFLMGLFSLLDALLDRPLANLLREVPLSMRVKQTLLGGPTAYAGVYDCMLAYERGQWAAATACAETLHVAETVLPMVYLASLGWANQQLSNTAVCA